MAAFVVRCAECSLKLLAAIGRNQQTLARRDDGITTLDVGDSQRIFKHTDTAIGLAFITKLQCVSFFEKGKNHRCAVFLMQAHRILIHCLDFPEITLKPRCGARIGHPFGGPTGPRTFIQQGPSACRIINLNPQRVTF